MKLFLIAPPLVGLILTPGFAWAGPSDIEVRVHCPDLSDAGAAEFEARAKVDLSVRSPRGGELDVTCVALSARVRWREPGGDWFARAVEASSAATLIDALLVASKELSEEAQRAPPTVSAEDRAQAQTSDSGAKDGEPSQATAIDSKQRAGDRRHATESDDEADRPAEGERASARSTDGPSPWRGYALGASAGTEGALFGSPGTGLAGVALGAFLEWPAGIITTLAGQYDIGIGAGDVVGVHAASATIVLAGQFGRAHAFELGVGAFAGSLFASASGAYQPASLSQGFWGGIVRARYAIKWSAWCFALGPDVRFFGFRPSVAVDHNTAWGVPAASVGLALDLRRDLYDSRP